MPHLSFHIIVCVWKFAPVIVNPVWAFGSPVQALLAVGSMQHIVVGCVIASVYIVWKSKKEEFSLRILLDDTNTDDLIVRSHKRKKMIIDNLSYEMLSPDFTGNLATAIMTVCICIFK